MKKNLKTLFIILLALAMVASLVAVAACKDKEPTTVNLTVDYGLDGVPNETVEVEIGKPFYGMLTKPASQFTFGGWYLDGEEVTSSTLAPKTDFTVKAKWRATYSVQYYLEKLNAEGEFELSTQYTVDTFGELGSTVSAEVKTIPGFNLDENNSSNVKSATLSANGTVLKLYYVRNTVTVTFDKLINGASGTMAQVSGKFGYTIKLPTNAFTSSFTFVGWNTAANGSGDNVADGGNLILNGNVTLYAQWETTYKIACYKEDYVGDTFDTEYNRVYEVSNTGIIGRGVSVVAANPDPTKYVLDEEKSDMHGVLTEEATTFTSYFKLRLFEIRYMDDNTVEYVKYGSDHTVRTPANDDEYVIILSYSNSPTGNGSNYEFGTVIKNVRANLTLYPVSSNIYYDESGNGDYVEIRRNLTGLGSAVFVKDGDRYEGWASMASGFLEFEVTVGSVTYFGRTYTEEGQNLFRYRGEEYGTYLYYDYIFDEIYAQVMLALDGYGTGIYAVPANDGTARVLNYYVLYEFDEEYGDYYMIYGLPDSETWYESAFILFKHKFEGDDYASIEGYFEEWNIDGESYEWVMYDNGDLYLVYLALDGYGNAVLYGTDGDDKVTWKVTGAYIGSNYYYDTGDPEYLFWSDDEGIYPSFYFILTSLSFGGQTVYTFVPKNAEYGNYTMIGADYPQLYLDGYGGAQYFTDADDEGRVGSYTLTKKEEANEFTAVIRFIDSDGGVMVVDIKIDGEKDGMSYGTFTAYEGGFIVNEQGVLTQYVYAEDVGPASVIVIPEKVNDVTVTEIAANVFNGISITSVTFPATLTKIGDYAFSNGTDSDASSLRTAIFLGSNPPELGKDVFRWIKGSNFRIIVPDGAADDYRNAASWKRAEASQPDGYAKFVTTAAEIADKPLYEVKNGVLVSYNNKELTPTNVEVVIPEQVDGVPVTEIADGVFTNLTYITSVKLNNVVKIGAYAFYGCTGITEITFNENTVSIGAAAFYNCYQLTEVNLGAVQEIGGDAFSRCIGLTKVIIGNGIRSIGDYAFYECGRSESIGWDGDEQVLIVEMHDLVVEIAATTAPEMGKYVFEGSQPHVYVANYDTALTYALSGSWATYVKHVRVHAQGEEQIWYSKSNQNGWMLVLGDRLIFDDNYVGWYKWIDDTTLEITWLVYSEIANQVTTRTQTARIVNGELVGIDLTWDEGVAYTFVPAGTTLTYASDAGETLVIITGDSHATFQSEQIELVMNGYRMQFEYNGYVYTVTLMADSNNLTFYYTKNKIVVIKEYTAADGSKLTIYFGNYVTANGRLLNVNNVAGGIYTETQGWYLIQIDENHYTFRWNHATGNYSVVITIESETTFSYTWSIASVVTVYRNAETGHIAVVTVPNDSKEATTIRIIFKTANGTDEQAAEILSHDGNVYTIKIDGEVEIEDLEGNVSKEPSTFNGTYTMTLHPSSTNPTFDLVKLD